MSWTFLPETKRSGFEDPYFSLLIELQDIFGREVDLVERQAIKNPYFVKVLALTERALYESLAKIAKSGVAHVLTKPYSADHLLRVVAEVLAARGGTTS